MLIYHYTQRRDEVKMNYLIGVDIGTSGTKTVLFDDKGNSIASHLVEYPMYQPKIGWAEQDPEGYIFKH